MTITSAPQPGRVNTPNHPGSPRVSVCIPAYQAERHLQATLESILAQDVDGLEIVVIDNNSSDGTRGILDRVHDPRVRVIRNTSTVPVVDNFNLAVRRSRGEFVKLVCADDILAPGCIGAQAAILDDLDDVALVSTRTDFIDEQGRLLRPARGLAGITGRHAAGQVIKRIVRSGTNPVGAPVATMFRRRDFDRCGGFRNEPWLPDLDLWVRLLALGDFFGTPNTLAAFRIGTGSITALTSSSSQLSEQNRFAHRLAADPRWRITTADTLCGRLKSIDMQVRRTGLYGVSALRDARYRSVRRRRSRSQLAMTSAGDDGGS
ncbi:MAG: glycosyltransferase [Mycobacterium sp.]|jgi:glycosyltransferase involved in cell wall biosynthesis